MQFSDLLLIWRPGKKPECKPESTSNGQQRRSVQSEYIGRLPPELWLTIYESLDLEDGASLALCNMAMRNLLGARNHQRLQQSVDRLAKVRYLLHADVYVPHHRLCFIHMAYHPRAFLTDWSECNLERFYRRTPYYASLTGTYLASVPFSCVQLATRPYRHKSFAYGIPLGKFEDICRRAHRQPPPRRCNIAWKISFRAAITDQDPPHLLLRAQSDLSLPRKRDDANFRKFIDQRRSPGCKHAVVVSKDCHQIADTLKRHFNGDEPSVIKLKCDQCPTEYHLESDNKKSKLTVWTDFGDGICPWEGEWAQLASHFRFNWDSKFPVMSTDCLSIEERFEAAFEKRISTNAQVERWRNQQSQSLV